MPCLILSAKEEDKNQNFESLEKRALLTYNQRIFCLAPLL